MGSLHRVSDHLHGDDFEIRFERLLFRCWHYGQESDLIFGSFAEASHQLSPEP